MRYLITHPDHEPFLTWYFDVENCFVEGMTVYDTTARLYTTDGKNWKFINEDKL